ncbi:MFS transporter [Streptomyces sp. A3M-1-3]|uniref:MFS transporter n=1 Tax=Streptomyces sp. A3M-1-3 TaxID=2962044 RepID=UPI0020B714A8|nr:MFS transporter [Streptomyces sp. A3M-1-3]MCP3822803.1 MFS transporter [Streptomyces sp. A3M-1-3]
MTVTLPSYARDPLRAPVKSRSRWWTLPVLLAAVFITTLDFFIANVAVPSIRADLQAGAASAQFVVAGYGLAYAAGLIISGRLGDLYGPRRVFTVGLALFTLASAACGAAPDASFLVFSRVVQGTAAALMGPQVLALLAALYAGADRPRAFGWYGAAVGLAGVSGQVVGGLLVAADPAGLGWRACFLVNIPIGAAALVMTRRLIPESRATAALPRPSRAWAAVDLPGAVLVATGLVAIVLPLIQGREQGWPAWTWFSLAASVPVMAAFIARQRRRAATGREPLLDLGLFTERGFTFGLLAVALLFANSAGLSFVLAVFLQEGLGLSPVTSGAVFTAINAGFLLASLQTRRLTRRLERRLPVVGALALTCGLALIHQAINYADPSLRLLPGLFLTGAGMGLVMSPLISAVLASAGSRHRGGASGVLGTVQETGGVLGIAVTGLVFFGALEGGTEWTGAVRAGIALLISSSVAVVALIWLHFRARMTN